MVHYTKSGKEKDRMARKKKNDFWDDVEEVEASETQSEDDSTASTAADEEWSAVKSLPLKVIMRFLLMISGCIGIRICGLHICGRPICGRQLQHRFL